MRKFMNIIKTTVICCLLWNSIALSEAIDKDTSGNQAEIAEGENVLPQCQILIQNCFNKQDKHKIDCFFASAKHPFCDGTQLSHLALKRWRMEPDRGNNINARARLNAKTLTNLECLNNFDNRWLATLISGVLTVESIKGLSEALKECEMKISEDLVRP